MTDWDQQIEKVRRRTTREKSGTVTPGKETGGRQRKKEKEKTESEAAGLNPGHKDRQLAVQKGKTVKVNKRLGCRGAEQESEHAITNTPTQLDGVLGLFLLQRSWFTGQHPSPHSCSLLAFVFLLCKHAASASCWRLFNSHHTCLISHFTTKKRKLGACRPSSALRCC